MRSSVSGQASTEYVGVLALLAVVLSLAATAVTAPDLRSAVVHHLKVALCMVGGDICRDADAKAKGLEACARTSEGHDEETTVTIGASVSGRVRWSLTQRSDGTWLLAAATGSGVSVHADLVKVHLADVIDGGIGASAGGQWLSGDAWVLDGAEARRVIARADGHVAKLSDDGFARSVGLGKPTYSYLEGGASATSGVRLSAGGDTAATDVATGDVGGGLLLGRRTGPDGAVWYFKGSAAVQTALGDLGIPAGELVVEYHAGPPASLVVRTIAGHGDESTEHIVTVPIRRPDVADMVLAAVRGGSVTQPFRDLVRGGALHERRSYHVDSRQGGGGATILDLGFDHRTSTIRRTLTGAELTVGGRKVQRVDCLGGI